MALLLLAVLACRTESRDAAPTSEPPLSTSVDLLGPVQVSGCAEQARGPVCEVTGTSTIVLWLQPHPAAEIEVGSDATQVAVTRDTVDTGLRITVHTTTAARALTVVATSTGGVDRFRLPLRAPPATAPAVRAAETRAKAGDYDEARAALTTAEATLSPRDRLRAHILQARMASRQGRGQDAVGHRQAARAVALQLGLQSAVVYQALAEAHTRLFSLRDIEGAAQATDAAAAITDFAPGAALVAYNRALVARESGDARSALRNFRVAIDRARRLDQRLVGWAATQARGPLLADLGRTREAVAATREALNHPRTQASVCAKGSAHLNHAWTVLLAREAGAPVESEDPRRELLVALSIFEGPCKDPAEIPNLLVNIALEALQRDDTKEAAASVTRAEKLEAPPSVRLWLLDLQGRVALRNAPTRALRLYDDLAGLASKTGSSEAEWRGAVGRARALVAMKQPGLAVLAYRRAEALLAHASRGVGIGQGRASLMAARVRSTREMVQLLFEQERHVEAAGAARRARMRMLAPLERQRQLDQLSPEDRTRWTKAIAEYRTTEAELEALTNNRWAKTAAELPALDRRVAKLRRSSRETLDRALALLPRPRRGPLTPPAPGAVALTLFDAGPEWIGVAMDATGASIAAKIDPPNAGESAQAAAHAILQPFAAMIEPAKAVEVYATGLASQVDIHALPYAGEPLVDRRAVSYPMDLAPASTTGGPALIIADPRGDLPAARDEAAAVAGMLRARGERVEMHSGRAVTSTALRRGLEAAGSLHFAGHGVHQGLGGWDSALPLAGSEGLDAGDILALRRVPSRVILSGCETGRAEDRGSIAMGLAQAFLLAGSSEVIAAVRPVRDEVAKAVSLEVHARGNTSLVSALQQAQKKVSAQHPAWDWAAFRVVVR